MGTGSLKSAKLSVEATGTMTMDSSDYDDSAD
jgi:hypothetical protein